MTVKKKSTKASTKKTNRTAKPTAGKAKKAPKASDKMSALNAAAKALGEAGAAMACKELIEAMATKGYWRSTNGKTPANTLYAAILREITAKKSKSRFKKTERGKFTLA
jgi:imidazolonepropionase-like amidohydrolase